jgi:tRNA-specific adenosine deaminase 2
MQQEQPPRSGQNSAQNPPPTPSSSSTSSSISPYDGEDILATNINGLRIEDPEEADIDSPFAGTETSPIALSSLGKPNKTPTTTTATVSTANDNGLSNPSPYTNLSRHAITNEMVFGPIPDREYHEGFMRKAIEMAQFALDSDETPVGCVFVRDGEVIGRGINGTNASLNVSFSLSYLPSGFWFLGFWFLEVRDGDWNFWSWLLDD